MSTVIRFLPDLSRWLVQGLDRGLPPTALVKTMVDEHMQPTVAQTIVDAFVDARRAGRPVPADAITVEDVELPASLGSRLPTGSRIATSERAVRVLARGDNPTLALLEGVVTADECDALIALARPRLQPSTVVDPDSGHDVVASYRVSVGMFFRPAENDLIARLDRRFSEVMNLPLDHAEGIQILRYEVGGATAPHHDFLAPTNAANQASLARSGQRVSTIITYLNDVEAGGETIFPLRGWSIAPHRGHSLYFESCDLRGEVAPQSLHAGNPVTRGEKWVATKWMRERKFVSA